MRKALCFLVGVLTTVSMISCSSDDNSDNSTLEDNFKDRSLVKSVTLSIKLPYKIEKYKYSFSYNTTGNLQAIFCETVASYIESREENYTWSQNNIHVEYHTSDNYYWRTDNFVRNSDGYVTSGEVTFGLYIYDWMIYFHDYNCLYNENNQLTQISGHIDSVYEQFDYTWENNNIVTIKKNNHLFQLEYYTDLKETRDIGLKYLPISIGHYTEVGNSLHGEIYGENPMFFSKNLLKKYFNGATTIEYFYDFDSQGRVIRQTEIITGYNQQNIQGKEYIYEYYD